MTVRQRVRALLSGSLGLAVALSLALGSAGLTAPPAHAATPILTMVTSATYDVIPDEQRVAVTVEITATSRRRDTATRKYTIDQAYLVVLPTASNLRLTGESGKPAVTVSSRSAAGTVVLLRFGTALASGKSLNLTLTFDVEDPGGATDRALRISPSLVAFTAWAFGTDDVAGSTVRVRLPAGYAAAIGRGPLSGPTTDPDGHLLFESDALATPATFVADVTADRPGVLLDERVSITVEGEPLTLLVRSWPDDPEWRARVGEVLAAGLPALGAAIGLAWPSAAELEVRETIARAGDVASADDGAGAFEPTSSRLDIPYTADPSAIVHGAAHGWFNAQLVADRWIAEGFAGLYAAQAGAAIGVEVTPIAMTPDALAEAVPLNAWVVGGSQDLFGHAAAMALANAIRELAGDEALRQVWRDAAAGIGAYQPEPPSGAGSDAGPEDGSPPLDWRSLLDLLEAGPAGSTGSFEKLWRQWVVRPADAALLDVRSGARVLYEEAVKASAPWVLPRSIRDAVRAWSFELATDELNQATEILELRREIEVAAAAVGLEPPDALRRQFEGTDGLQTAAAEAVTERAVIGAFEEVLAARPVDPDLMTQAGLIGVDPEPDIAAARLAFARGDLDETARLAASARAIWDDAPAIGRGRLVSGAAIAIAALLLLWLAIPRRRGAAR